jgi:tRNA wybutosine-synthesizing protein 1
VDRPELIIEGALEHHRRMVAQMKGVPGVRPERFADALVPKHCALSLVGGQPDAPIPSPLSKRSDH